MTYSMGTIRAKENDEMVWHILDDYPSMQLVPIGITLGYPGLPGLGLSDDACTSMHHFDPSDVAADTKGFFVAKLGKPR